MEYIRLQKTNMCPGQMSQEALISFILSLMATKVTPKKLYQSAAGYQNRIAIYAIRNSKMQARKESNIIQHGGRSN